MADGKSLADVVAHVRPRTKSVRICLRGDLAEEHDRLSAELVEAQRRDKESDSLGAGAEAPAIAERLVDLEQQMRDTLVTFTFQAMGKSAWSDLLASHPPTKSQKDDLRLDHNPETFSVAAITASLVEPSDASLEQVENLANILSLGQWSRLWQACLAANIEGDDPGESSAASLLLRGSRPSSGSVADTASLEASS